MTLYPLTWPERRAAGGCMLQRLLASALDGSSLGQILARRQVRAQLKKRGCIDLTTLWGPNPQRVALAEDISKRIAAHCNWPSPNFIQNDPFWIMLTESCQGLQSVCAVMDLQAHYMVEDDVILHPERFTYGEFVDYLLRRNFFAAARGAGREGSARVAPEKKQVKNSRR